LLVGGPFAILLQTLLLKRFPNYVTLVLVGFWTVLHLAGLGTKLAKCLNVAMKKAHGSLLPLASAAQRALIDAGSYDSSNSTARSILCQSNGKEVLWVVDTRDAGAERPLFASTVCDHVHASQLTGDTKELFSGRSLGKHTYCSTENNG
jgi:hypothetical protein